MIYFDNAATTKPDKSCVEAAEKYLYQSYFNPSAMYAEGVEVKRALRTARDKILTCIADSENFDLVFTSGGTEADNQAVFGGAKRGNFVTTLGEHSAVFSCANELKNRGIEVRFANLNSDGSVKIEHLLSLVDEKTSLVSVIHVNSETGAVNDVAAISAAVKAKNSFALFHCDGVQAFGKIPFKLTGNIDLYSVSSHKIGGLKGCGALFKRKNLALKPFVYGGGQENGLRSGTENVFGIKIFENAAVEKYDKISQNYASVSKIKTALVENLDKNLFKILSPDSGSPYILTVSAAGVRGETVLHMANDRGLIIGTGSACSSNEKKRYSRIILACGADEKIADGVLRMSFSPDNSVAEAADAAKILNKVVSELIERTA